MTATGKKIAQRNLSLEAYGNKLLEKIARAGSEKDIHRYIDAAIRAMHTQRVNPHLVDRFITRMSSQLLIPESDHLTLRSKNFALAASLIPELRKQLFGKK